MPRATKSPHLLTTWGIRVIQVVGDSRSIEKHAFATKDVLRYSIDPCKDVYQARNGPHRLPKFLTFDAVAIMASAVGSIRDNVYNRHTVAERHRLARKRTQKNAMFYLLLDDSTIYLMC